MEFFWNSAQNIFNHVPEYIRQAVIAPAKAIRQSRVIDAEQMQDRGVEIVDVDFVFRNGRSDFVGVAIGQSAFDARASQPRRETRAVVAAPFRTVHAGRAAE